VQRVTHPTFGHREFAIYVDAFDQFFVFPTSGIGALNASDPTLQNVDPSLVQQAHIDWPDWVFRKSERFMDFFFAHAGSVGEVEFPEYDWKSHPDGTKFCAVVFERQEALFDSAYYAVNQGASPLTESAFNAYRDVSTSVSARHMGTFDPTNLPTRYCIGTGLLEVTIGIALTGPSLGDYSVVGTVNEIRRPTESPYCSFLAGYTWYDVPDGAGGYIANRGDLCALDIERYYRVSDNATASFFSLKNLTQTTEMKSWNGGTDSAMSQVVDYEMASLSFVLNMPLFEQVTRVLDSTSIPYTTVHPSACIITFGQLRDILFPNAVESSKRDAITALMNASGRSQIASGDWTFLPMNDVRDWSDSALGPVRDWYATNIGYKAVSAPTPTAAQVAWFEHALSAYFNVSFEGLLYIQTPRFSWYAYSDEIMNRLAISPRSTFYAHPNGTYAFFDQHRIYNAYGVPGNFWPGIDILGDFQANAVIEHFICDKVHLENSRGATDTSFESLYNSAVAAGGLSDVFSTIYNLRAIIDKGTATLFGGSFLELSVAFGGANWFYVDTGVSGPTFVDLQEGGGAVDLTLGDDFYTGLSQTGNYLAPTQYSVPVTFSSVVMIT
jgi:hypothetical protein